MTSNSKATYSSEMKRRDSRPAVLFFQYAGAPKTSLRELRGFLSGQRGHCRGLLRGTDDLHLLPVVGHLFATIQAHNVGSSGECRATSRSLFHGDGKAVVIVGTTEQHIQNPGKHPSTSTGGGQLSGGFAVRLLLTLDSALPKRVRKGSESTVTLNLRNLPDY